MEDVLLDRYDVAVVEKESVGTLGAEQVDRDVVCRVCAKSVKIRCYSAYFGVILS